MKNEEKILGMLEKQGATLEKHSEFLEKQGAILDKHSKVLETLVQGQAKLDQRMDGLDQRMNGLEQKIDWLEEETTAMGQDVDRIQKNVVKIQVTLENDIRKDIRALYDGHKQNTDVIERIDKKLEGYDKIETLTAAHNVTLDTLVNERKSLKKA